MQPYFWLCAECGWKTEEFMDSCPNCGNRIWGKVSRIQEREDQIETSYNLNHNPSPHGSLTHSVYLTLVSELLNSIECGACSAIVWRSEGKFDQHVLKDCLKKHYVESPSCNPSKN
ncbi:MAG TPA: hypothetical protein VLV31_07560 [Candidatus Acidoferrales bacterium]|nr:hypothetical protein [Candidatus Acidoferrales bacterium]